MERTTSFQSSFAPNEDDFRERIHPKKNYKEEDPDFIVRPYYQVFQERLGFLPNLSIVDLLFNMGPESLLVLQKSFENFCKIPQDSLLLPVPASYASDNDLFLPHAKKYSTMEQSL